MAIVYKSKMRYIGFMKTIKQIERPSLREQVYQSLKEAIITLELSPGQRVRDKELAARFGVSRTPVREALRRLEDEGLVESMPGSLTRTAPLNVEEVKQAFTVVAVLHALAARLAVPFLTEEDFGLLEDSNTTLKKAIHNKDAARAVKADDQFHEVFLQRSANREIDLAMERVLPKIRRLEFAKFNSIKGLNSVEQHGAIMEAARQRSEQDCSKLVEENWLRLGSLLTNNTESMGGRENE